MTLLTRLRQHVARRWSSDPLPLTAAEAEMVLALYDAAKLGYESDIYWADEPEASEALQAALAAFEEPHD